MKSISIFSRTTKFGLAAVFGIILVSSACAATTAIDLTQKGNPKYEDTNWFKTNFGSTPDLLFVNGTLTGTGEFNGSDKYTRMEIGEGATVKFGKFVQTLDASMIVSPGGKVMFTGDNAVFGYRSGQNNLTVNGGTVESSTDLGIGFATFNKNDGTLDATLIVNSGIVKTASGKNLYVGYETSKDKKYKPKSYSSVFTLNGGTVNLGGNLYVGNKAGTDYVTGTPDRMCAVLNGGDLTCKQIWEYKGTTDTTIRFNGTTIHTGNSVDDSKWIGKNGDVTWDSYFLDGGGVTLDVTTDANLAATICEGTHDEGTPAGALVKTGDATLTISAEQKFAGAIVCKAGTIDVNKKIASTDLRAVGGTIDLTDAILPSADKIDLMLAGANGQFIELGMSDPYKSLTLGEDAALPVDFANGAVTTFTAPTFAITATAEHPIVIKGTGSLTKDTVVFSNLPPNASVDLFVLDGVAGSLEIKDGSLIAVKPLRLVDTLTWAKGSAGDYWTDEDNWTYVKDGVATATTFQAGDTALFAGEGDEASVNEDVTATKVEFAANATVTGTAMLNTTNITVDTGVKATISAPLGLDFTKTGEGELVLKDYKNGKALDLQDGQVTLAWSDTPGTNPFSTETDANAIAGTLDLGGATQTFDIDLLKNGELLKSGAKFLNGTVNLNFTTENWMTLSDVSLVIGPDTTLNTLPKGDGASSKKHGELNLTGSSQIIIDGGTFNNNNTRTGEGNDIGNDTAGTAMLRVTNGGTFNSVYNYVQLGVKSDATGILSGDHGTINISEGKKALVVGVGGTTKTAGIVALTNSVLKVNEITLCKSLDGVTAQFTLVDTVAYLQRMETLKKPSESSFVLFDGATLVAKEARTDFLADLKMPTTIGANGLVISNDYDITVAAPLSGAGKLSKKGSGKLTFAGTQSFEGGLEVCEGSIGVTLTKDGSATADIDLMLNLAEGKKLKIDIAGTPEPGENYTLFNSGITEETFPLLEIDANYELSLEDGQLKVKLSPLKLTWTGEGEDDLWSTYANWRDATTSAVPERDLAQFDTVVFESPDGGETEYDLVDKPLLKEIDVNSGAWTTKVDQTIGFASVPIKVEKDALFALTGAKVTNPFSTAKDANYIAGVLDLGGATQTFAGALADEKGIFRDGGEIRNVEMTVDPSGWFRLHNVSFTIGKDAKVTVNKYENSNGQINFYNTHLIIDGGELNALNARKGDDYGGYVGNKGDAVIEVLNGGKLYHPNKQMILGYANDGDGRGTLVADNDSTLDFGNQNLVFGYRNGVGSESCLAMTNSTLVCRYLQLGFNKDYAAGAQTIILAGGTTATIAGFDAVKVNDDASITFDNATIVDNGKATALLSDLGIPYTIAEGGLTVKVANLDQTKEEDYVSFPGTFEGEGDFILVAAGKTPREARFSGVAEKGFTGNVVVSNGVTVTARNKTFKGGLYACEGSTLDVATSIFEGVVTLEDGVKFATEGVTMDKTMTNVVTVLKTKGAITLPAGGLYDQTTRNGAFIVQRNGYKELRYGRQPGLMILIK